VVLHQNTLGPLGIKVEEFIMDKISNTAHVNLVKVIFGIFPTLAIINI
jgi:hypothetical protein